MPENAEVALTVFECSIVWCGLDEWKDASCLPAPTLKAAALGEHHNHHSELGADSCLLEKPKARKRGL